MYRLKTVFLEIELLTHVSTRKSIIIIINHKFAKIKIYLRFFSVLVSVQIVKIP